ncbi:hypothetical protein BKA70DRAFT_202802 [Coprinopsis sp. MPI-PUGE-AT-0042]|nr:hypothetical protein BKA70DRAFT_202802 [Coprinopsis sp. MPI-PUGE-AT-0042]
MPGPGRNKGKKKSSKSSKGSASATSLAPSTSAASEPSPYVSDIDDAEGWTPIVNILCEVFNIPDLTNRKGLKKVHLNFDAIYKRLENAYASNLHNERIKGGIVGIYSKMCIDSLLRNKLIEKGLLDKLLPLVAIESTRRMALRALVTITHHGGAAIRAVIATHSPVIISTMEQHPEDESVNEMGVSILTHAIGAVTEGNETGCAYPKVLKQLDTVKILGRVIEAAKIHPTNRILFEHATELVAASTLHASEAYSKVPEATRFLVAGLRCKDWVMRSMCLGGLIRLHRKGAEDDQRSLDPQWLIRAASKGVPDHIADVLMDWGPPHASEIFRSLESTRDFQQAISTVPRDKDLHAFGLKCARLILKTEFSIPDGYFETINERTGRREIMEGYQIGLPFTRYADALPLCAKAIREKGKPEEADLADILEIKFKIMRGKVGEAAKQAQKALERSPQNAYFYYAISLSADHTTGLRAAKKGLKCKNTTPFVHWQLTQRAVEHAGDFGLQMIYTTPTTGEHKWEEGIAFLMSAYEDAKAFLKDAPPDNRYMKNVSYWYILLTILMEEEISPDLRELKAGIDRLKFADECSTFMGIVPPRTMLRKTQETAVNLLPEALKEFGPLFDRGARNADSEKARLKEETFHDDLSAWLDNLTLEDDEEPIPTEAEMGNVKVDIRQVSMYRCSHCGNPSAALRKCSGCAKTRYCDGTCQKAHWPEHKKQCRVVA